MTASWAIVDRATGNAVFETYRREVVQRLDTAKYEAVPILRHLASLNSKDDPTPPRTAIHE